MNKDTRQLNQAILSASEECQRDVAQLVHDTICQTLGGVSLMVKVLGGELHSGIPLTVTQLDDLNEVLDRALDEARHVFTQLQPVPPGSDGLMTALARLARETSSVMPCDFESENAVLIDSHDTSITLYRIAAEAVKNAVSRANVTRIMMSLNNPDGTIVLKVSHDGKAYSEHAESKSHPVSELMQLRAQTAGGMLTFESALGQDTTVTFTLPKRDMRSDT